MNPRDMHVGKGQLDKQRYQKYIGKLPSEPTLEQKLPFPDSNQDGEDYATATASRERPVSYGERVRNHFKEQWPAWLATAIVAVGGYFVFQFRLDMQKVDLTGQETRREVATAQADIKGLTQKNSDQDLKIQENAFRIDMLGQKISDFKDFSKKRN